MRRNPMPSGLATIDAANAKGMSKPEMALLAQILDAGLPLPRYGKSQWRFHPGRKWQADFAWPDRIPAVIVEVEGGQWVRGRHNRPQGFERDAEKYNEAALALIVVIRVTPAMIDDGRALAYVMRALKLGERRD